MKDISKIDCCWIEILEEIQSYLGKTIIDQKKINSGDGLSKHLYIETEDKQKYLIKRKLMKEETYTKFVALQNKLQDNFQKVIHSWKHADGFYIMVYQWIPGITLNQYYANAENEEKYAISTATDILRKLHNTYITEAVVPCSLETIDTMLNVEFLNASQKKILREYITKNIDAFENKATIVHGDMHIDNIVVSSPKVFYIDLDDIRIGHPYMDLVYAANIHYSRQLDKVYYLFLNSYFENKIPDNFWKLVNIYSISKILCIMRYEIEKSENHLAKISMDDFIGQHCNMKQDEPEWFLKIKMENGFPNYLNL